MSHRTGTRMKKKPGITEAILAGIGDAEKDDERDNVRGEDPSKDDDAPEHRDTLDMAGPPDIDKVVATGDSEFAPDANMMIKDDDSPEITQEQRSLVGEFWNARESYDYSSGRGHPVDVVKASKRMEAAANELIHTGFFKNRTKMPTLDELGPETVGDVEEAVPSSVPSAADPIPQYGEDQPDVGGDQPEAGEDETIERMADVAHASWTGWMEYMFGKVVDNDDGTVTIPAELVERWRRQMAMPYSELSDEEKESDRVEARKYAAAMNLQGEPAEECFIPPQFRSKSDNKANKKKRAKRKRREKKRVGEDEGEGEVALVLDRGRAVKMGLTADDVDPEELRAGVEVEMEHTDDARVAEVIALDHLAEDRGYYTGDDGLIAWERRKTGDPHDDEEGAGGHEEPATREPYHSMDMHDEPGEDDGW